MRPTRMKKVEHVERMGERKHFYRILVWIAEEKPIRRSVIG
jgi:hypothetical protein